MRRTFTIVGCVLLAVALGSPAWAKKGGGGGGGGGEPQKGGLPGLEDRVDTDEGLIATLQSQVSTLQGQVAGLEGQNNFAQVSSSCAIISGSASALSATSLGTGSCEITFTKDVSACSWVATIIDAFGEVSVANTTNTIVGDSVIVNTDVPAGTPANEFFNLTVTCL